MDEFNNSIKTGRLSITKAGPLAVANKCKGLVFRAYSSTFFNYKNGKVEKREGFRLLKSKSCKGCAGTGRIACDRWYLDDMDDIINCEGLIFPKYVEHGALYGIRAINITRDWESGYVDGYDFEFFKLEKK